MDIAKRSVWNDADLYFLLSFSCKDMDVDCVRLHFTEYDQKQEHIFQHHVLLLVKHIAVSICQNISSVAIWQTIDKKLWYIR